MANLFLDGSKLYHHLDEVTKWTRGEAFPPIHVEISPTNACNYRCTFCYADFTGHKNTRIEREVLLQLVQDMGAMGVKSCLFAGDGEPTLVDHVMDAVKAGKAAGVDMALNTNGLLFTPKWAASTLPYLTWLRFSFMAATPKTYAMVHGVGEKCFDQTLKNIEAAVLYKQKNNLDVTIGVQQVLLPENGHETLALAQQVKDLGADYFVLKPFSLHEANANYQDGVSAIALRDEYAELFHQTEALSNERFASIIRWNTFSDDGRRSYDRCLGLPFIAQIAADSVVYTCCPFFYRARYAYGDLKEKRFPEIWFSETAREIRESLARDLDVHSECMSYCRHHQINILLWKLHHPPAHVNFL